MGKLFTEDLTEEALALSLALAARLGKLLEQLFLLGVKLSGSFNDDGEDEIALRAPSDGIKVGNALALYGKSRSRLRSLGNGELRGSAAKQGNVYLGSESRLREGK